MTERLNTNNKSTTKKNKKKAMQERAKKKSRQDQNKIKRQSMKQAKSKINMVEGQTQDNKNAKKINCQKE